MSERQITLVLDPAHGGTQAVGGSSPNRSTGPNGLLEKDLTLDLAGRVRDQLSGNSIRVVLTREDDINRGIQERVDRARGEQADAFVSLHFNASEDAGRRGSVAFTGRGSGENARALAEALVDSVAGIVGVDGEVRTRNLSVINPSKHLPRTAAVLLETAYLSNPELARQLENETFRDQLATAIANALRRAVRSSRVSTAQARRRRGSAFQASPEPIPLEPAGGGGMSIGESALEVGDIIVSTTEERVSEIIRGVSGSKVSHAALYVGDGLLVEAVASGVRLKTLVDALQDDLYAVALRHPDVSEYQGQLIRDFAGQQVDLNYDFRGIAMHALYRVSASVCDELEGAARTLCDKARWQVAFGNDDADRWYCSELVFSAYEAAGVPLGTKPAASTPGSLLQLDPPLEYVGHLKTPVSALSGSQSYRTGRAARVHPLATAPASGVDVKLRVFIPSPAVGFETGSLQVGQAFGGDGRSFAYSGGTSRAEIHARIGLAQAGGTPSLTVIDRHWGESTEYDVADVDYVSGRPFWWLEKRAGVTPKQRATLTLSDDNLSIKAASDNGLTRVSLKVDGGIPFMSSAPNINADLELYLKVENGRLKARIEGDHDGFPSYELYVEQTRVYEHNSVAADQTPLSLSPPSEFDVDTAWVDIGPAPAATAQVLSGEWLPRSRSSEAAVAAAALAYEMIAGAAGQDVEISWNLPAQIGAYHPLHDQWSETQRRSKLAGSYTMVEVPVQASTSLPGGLNRIYLNTTLRFWHNGRYIKGLSIRQPNDYQDAALWSLRVTAELQEDPNIFRHGSNSEICRVLASVYFYFDGAFGPLERSLICRHDLRAYSNGHWERRVSWNNSVGDTISNLAEDIEAQRSGREPKQIAQALSANGSFDIEDGIRVSPVPGDWSSPPELVALAPRPVDGGGADVAVASLRYFRPHSLGGLPLLPSRPAGDFQRTVGSLGLNPGNQAIQRQYSATQSLHRAEVIPIGSAASELAQALCAGDYAWAEDSSPALAMNLAAGRGRVRSLSLNLISITHAGPYRIAYDRLTQLGVIEPLPRRDTRRFRGTQALQDALNTWAAHVPTVMDEPNYILTGGVYVDKPGEHGRGNAIDVDGFWWSATDKFLANDAPTDWYRYLTIEATLRKAFGTVLNYDYNRAHHDHWHCDLGRSTTWRRVSSQSYFAQRALNEIWGEDLSVDGDWGNLSNGAATRNGYDFSAPGGWDHFLDDIINQQSTPARQSAVFRGPGSRSLEAEADNETALVATQVRQTEILNQIRDYEDPSNFPVNLPEAGEGVDQFTASIPEGLQFSYVDVEYLDQSPLAKAEVTARPQRGASGQQSISVTWSHPPYGKIKYRVRAYASQGGHPAPVRITEGDPGFDDRTKLLVEQDVVIEMLVKGPRAKMLYDAIQRANREQPSSESQVACAGACIVAGVVIVVVIAAVISLGFMVLYAILTEAMSKGYDIKDTKYKAAAGEGASRQEHEMIFNLTRPSQ